MQLTFLSASVPLTKSYVFAADGSYDSTPYPLTKEFTSHIEHIETLDELYTQIKEHGDVGHCLLKGQLDRPIIRESRAGLHASVQTILLVLDFDTLDLGTKTLDELLAEIGLGDVSYVLQYSAGQGIKTGLNAHVFMILDQPIAAEMLKNWLKWKNLTVGHLRSQLSLTKTNMALHWPLDITLAQNDKLIYVAPPSITGIEDPCPQRLQIVHKTKGKATLDTPAGGLEESTREIIKQLRAAKGLPDHNLDVRFIKKHSEEILKNPDRAAVTGVKRQAPFTYVNLNGGDSWGYFHQTERPDVLHNFKGEPCYLLEELCPDYYKEALSYVKQAKREVIHPNNDFDYSKTKHWVVSNQSDGKYFKVEYKPDEGITLYPAPTIKHLQDYCVIKNVEMPPAVPDWNITFDPTDTEVVNNKERKINTFKPTRYKLHAVRTEQHYVDDYLRLIHHAVGSCDESMEYFLNWVAFIFQTGLRPKTSWLVHGTQGTGKGKVGKVLEHLFGDQYVSVLAEGLSDTFNEHLMRAQIVWLDEITMDAWDNGKMSPKLRALIDGEVQERAMRKAWKTGIEVYFGLIAAANEYNPVEIRLNDRRWNVAPRQETPIKTLDWWDSKLINEQYGLLYQPEQLQKFANYLESYPVDEYKVLNPMDNEAKNLVMRTTQSLQEDVVHALRHGDADYFVAFAKPVTGVPDADSAKYREVVQKIMHGGDVAFTTSDIKTLFEYIVGWNNQASGKFNKSLQHAGMDLKTIRDGKKVFRGARFTFHVSQEAKDLWASINDQGVLRAVRPDERTGTDG